MIIVPPSLGLLSTFTARSMELPWEGDDMEPRTVPQDGHGRKRWTVPKYGQTTEVMDPIESCFGLDVPGED
jgi:hypothetical protein